MRVEGFQFPECTVTEAMFRVDQPPDWVEADNCYGCRAAFGPITRKVRDEWGVLIGRRCELGILGWLLSVSRCNDLLCVTTNLSCMNVF